MLPRVDYFKSTDDEFKIIEYNLTAVSMHAHSENFLQAQKLLASKDPRFHENFYPHNTPCTDIA